jgi:protein-tyrosine-phosphatase
MAEGIFKKYLAQKLSCSVDDLDSMGYKVRSAGTLNIAGAPASGQAIAACTARGVDIAAHRSTALLPELIDESDFIFVMGGMHRDRVLALSPAAEDKCRLLVENQEVPDPIGQPQQVYDTCAEMIEKAVGKRLAELDL